MAKRSIYDLIRAKDEREGRREAPDGGATRGRVREALKNLKGIDYYKAKLAKPEALRARVARDSFSLIVSLLRDYWGGRKYGSTKTLFEHLGFDEEDLMQVILEICTTLNPALANRAYLRGALQQKRSVDEIVFYDLLGLHENTPHPQIDTQIARFRAEMDRHPRLIAFPHTQAIGRLKIALRGTDARLDEEAPKAGVDLSTPLNARFSVPHGTPAATAAGAPAAAGPAPIAATTPAAPPPAPAAGVPAAPPAAAPEGINFARVRAERIPDAILQFMDDLYYAFKEGPEKGSITAGNIAVDIDRRVRGFGIELYKGEKTDVLEIIRELFNIRIEADLAGKAREIYDLLKPVFPQFIPPPQNRPRPEGVRRGPPPPPPPPEAV